MRLQLLEQRLAALEAKASYATLEKPDPDASFKERQTYNIMHCAQSNGKPMM